MKITLVFKGGPGSGHHGHVGRPGKVGGSSSGGVEYHDLYNTTLYHGTKKSMLDSINIHGLKPNVPTAGRPGGVYFSTSKDVVLDYLADRYQYDDVMVVISFKLRQRIDVDRDDNPSRPESYSTTHTIPPDWIESIELYRVGVVSDERNPYGEKRLISMTE